MSTFLIIGIIAAIVIAGGLYYFVFRKKPTPVSAFPDGQVGKYTTAKSVGVPAELPKDADGNFYFDFPTKDANGDISYVYTAPATVGQFHLGNTVKLSVSLTGNGTIVPIQGDPPARLTLFIQRQGDPGTANGEFEFYRWLCKETVDLAIGDFTISTTIAPGHFNSIKSRDGNLFVADFSKALGNLVNVGVVLGGSVPDQGAFVQDGTARLTIKEFTVK